MVMLIITKYKGPTNSRGARFVAATVEDMPVQITRPFDYSIGQSDNHLLAARALAVAIGLDHMTVVEVACKGGNRYWTIEGEN